MIVSKKLKWNPNKWRERPRYELDLSIDKKRVHIFYDYSEISETRLIEDIEERTGQEVVVYMPDMPAIGVDITFYLCILGYLPKYKKPISQPKECCPHCGERISGYVEA